MDSNLKRPITQTYWLFQVIKAGTISQTLTLISQLSPKLTSSFQQDTAVTNRLVVAKSSYPHPVELLAGDLHEVYNHLYMPPSAMQSNSLSVHDNELLSSHFHLDDGAESAQASGLVSDRSPASAPWWQSSRYATRSTKFGQRERRYSGSKLPTISAGVYEDLRSYYGTSFLSRLFLKNKGYSHSQFASECAADHHPPSIANSSTNNSDLHSTGPVNDGTEAEQAIGSLLANLNDLEFDESFINSVLDLISAPNNSAEQQSTKPM